MTETYDPKNDPDGISVEKIENSNPPQHDLVFGELNEDGPNYRNVQIKLLILALVVVSNLLIGRFRRNHRLNDQDPNRSGCASYSNSIRCSRHRPWSHMSMGHRSHYNMV